MSILRSALSLLGIEARADDAPTTPPAVMPPSRAAAGGVLTADQALGLSSVYRAVAIVGTAATQLTLDAWRGDELLDPKPSLIRRPDLDDSLSGFLEATTVSLATSGSAYWKITRNARNEVTGAKVLDPNECQPLVDPKDGSRTLGYRGKRLKPDEYKQLWLMRVPGHHHGLGPIQAARYELLGARDLTSYASEWFTTGDTPSGVLKTEQTLSPDQAEAYKTKWQERDAHSVAVLGNGLDYKPVLLSPEDAQFIESQRFSVTQVARLFGIPAHLMLASVEGGSMTYANMAQADLTFVRWTLLKYLREIEEAFSSLLPGITTARFNLDALLRPDTTSRYQAHAVALTAGFLTIDEVRALEGLPKMTTAPTTESETE